MLEKTNRRDCLKDYFIEEGRKRTVTVTRENCGEVTPGLGGDLLEGFSIDDFRQMAGFNEQFLKDEAFRRETGGDQSGDFLSKFEKDQTEWIELENQLNEANAVNLLAGECEDYNGERWYYKENPMYSEAEKKEIQAFQKDVNQVLMPVGDDYFMIKARFSLKNAEMTKERIRRWIFYTGKEKPWKKLREMKEKADFMPDQDIIEQAKREAVSNGVKIDEAWEKKYERLLKPQVLKVGDTEFPFVQLSSRIGDIPLKEGNPVNFSELMKSKKTLQPKADMEAVKKAYEELVPHLKEYQGIMKFEILERKWVDGVVNAEILEYQNVFLDDVFYPKLSNFVNSSYCDLVGSSVMSQ